MFSSRLSSVACARSAQAVCAAPARGMASVAIARRAPALSAARCSAAAAAASSSAASAASPAARAAPLTRRFSTHTHKPSVLVVGGNGALGQAMISSFKHAGYRTLSMDFAANAHSDVNILLQRDRDWKQNLTFAEEKLHEILHDQPVKAKLSPLSVVIHSAGSWMGGAADTFIPSVDPMLDINLKSAISAAHLAGKFLSDAGDGMLVLTGAAAAANHHPTPGMLAYGMSKAATHHLALSLAHPDSGLKNATVTCLLPVMIDTPSNRAMSSSPSDHENWTPPKDFAELTLAFAQQLQASKLGGKAPKVAIEHAKAPLKNAGFYVFETAKGKTSIKLLTQAQI